MKVDILEHKEDGTQRRVATFQWQDGELNCDNPVLWKHLMNSSGGVIIGARGKRYYPRDGVEYLRNLKYQFAGPYLWAQPPDEEAEPPVAPTLPTAPSAALPTTPLLGSALAGSTLTGNRPAPQAPPPEPPEPKASSARPLARPPLPTSVRPRELKDVPRRPVSRDARPEPEPEGEIPRQVQESICGGVFRLAAAHRGLAFHTARLEADNLLKQLSELVQIDFPALRRAYEAREEYLELRYQPPSRLNYARVWDRMQRSWQSFLEVLEKGDLPASLWPLFLVREALTILPEHRSEWLQSSSMIPVNVEDPAGCSAAEVARSWNEAGMPAFRKKGLSAALLEEVSALAGEPFTRALQAFQQAGFGQAELELRQALMIDPGHVDARLLLGDLLRRMDRIPESLSELQRTIELEHLELRTPQAGGGQTSSYLRMTRARLCGARALLSVGRVREAIDQLERGLESLEWLTRKTPPESLAEPERQQWREDQLTIHRLIEPLYRAVGETERADAHRKRVGALGLPA